MNDHINLAELNILALDCQATGANPDKGHLLEIGWIPGRAGSSRIPEMDSAESYLIRLQTQTAIPPAVQRLTGISATAMTHAVPEGDAWRSLQRAAQATAAHNQAALCPAVIHFARFEVPFLRKLHAAHAPGTPFPFHIICTHAIAVRLLPDLPRRGIRAVAGYLGHSMPEFKRSADHALATLVIWEGMLELLQTRCEINSLQQLTAWLAASHAPGRTKRVYPMSSKVRLGLPDQPGIYRMRSANADILYIGKAKSLKQRVNSYFRSHATHPEHILEMLSQAWNIDFSPTGSALEAAVMESDEIKRHRPPYNKALRSDKRTLVFCTRDLKKRAVRSDQRFCIGPLPDGQLIDALQALQAWLAGGPCVVPDDLPRLGCLLPGMPPNQLPAIQDLNDGFDLFRSNHRRYLQNRSTLRIVTALGAALWRSRLDALAGIQAGVEMPTAENEENLPSEQSAAAGEHIWIPVRIAGAIEGMLARSAHLMRRARWYCLLSEACLAWSHADDPGGSKNLMIFEHGRLSHRDVLSSGRKVPVPSGFGRSWPDRRNNLDLAAYDRMRVVTTELRRLVGQGRKIELRFGPKAALTASELRKALQWI